MTRHPVSARGRKTTATGRDRESVGWRMWCDQPGCAESSETRPTQHDLPLAEFAAAGWHVAEKWGDICPTCLAKGDSGTTEPDVDRARRALRAFIEHLDAAPSAAVLDALNSALLAYDPPPPEPPADPQASAKPGLELEQPPADLLSTLRKWFDANLTYEHFESWLDEDFAAELLPALQAHVTAEVERARGAAERALALIAGTSCENSTSGPGACWRDYRDPNAKYGAERWCDPCIALAALTPDATDKLWQEHPGIDQHDEVATGGEQRG